MKTLQINLTLIASIFILMTSCSPDDDGVYFDKTEETKVEYSEIELQILDLVNEYRVSKGLNSLEKMNIISTVAKTHTTYMAEIDEINHTDFAKRQQQLIEDANAKNVGENVGYGYRTAQGVVDAWIASDSHRALLEKEIYTHFGISTEQNLEGRNYFTQIFIER